jgi:hypothetical protein
MALLTVFGEIFLFLVVVVQLKWRTVATAPSRDAKDH